MAGLDEAGLDEAGLDEAGLDVGERLVARRSLMDRGEVAWLGLLAEFDGDQLWSVDGQLSCVDWLIWRLRMSRATAFEKLRIAHELRRRPQVAEALAEGIISYSAARVITRLDRPDPEVDAALVQLAVSGTVRDLEHAVRHYQLCVEQDRAPDLTAFERRGARIRRGPDGLGSMEVTLDELEIDELAAALLAFMDHPTTRAGGARPVDESPRGDCPAAASAGSDTVDESGGSAPVDESPREDRPIASGDGPVTSPGPVDDRPGPVDESPREDPPADQSDPPATGRGDGGVERVPLWQRRADALMDLVRTAMAHLGDCYTTGADRYLVHLVTQVRDPHDHATRLDGTPLTPAQAARAACDTATVSHLVDGQGGVLDLGRRTRVWTAAQRRAVAVRDGGTCRFPGCIRLICDLHHLQPWSEGGPTSLENGLYLCTRHHTLVHQGYTATGNANGEVTFSRPDHTPLGTSHPLAHHWQLMA